MTPVTYAADGDAGVLRLDDGKANAINPAWLDAAEAALDVAEADATTALVVLGRRGFFSAGLDLAVLPTLPPAAMHAVSRRFVALVVRLFLFPKPTFAAADGHALAGGFMLYCAADVRLAVDEPRARFGLTELAAGVPVVGPTAAVVASVLRPRDLGEVLLHGRRLTAAEAHERGVVHALVADADALHPAARARVAALYGLDLRAHAATKAALRRPLVAAAEAAAADVAALLPSGNPLAGRGR